MATKRYTQRELEIFVRCWQTATNLEGLVTALKDHPEHRTITEEYPARAWPSSGNDFFTDQEKTKLESEGWTVTEHVRTWNEGERYERADRTCYSYISIDWAKRRGHIMRKKGVNLKHLGESNGPSGVSYASLNAIASEYR